ncbi:50S ribosomal protein L35ae [Candidatus Micrarchaeota archaeon]|nr:50S ribosomal protein L35ae [Candidatus Micrarchaeota archaeon]
MKGKIINYRGGTATQNNNQMVVQPENANSRESASKLLGKRVEWVTPANKKMVGTISKVHGKKGCVLVGFNTPLPGQSIGSEVTIFV